MRKPKKFFGMATVGTKGQIVIPVEAREDLGIKEGDKLVILRGRTNKTLVIVTDAEIGKKFIAAGLDDDDY